MISQFSIIDAMDDPLFFGPFFKRSRLRGDTWQAWRVFLAALFALPMDSEQLALYKKHTGRTTAPAEQFNEAFAIVGRRGGKSRIAALIGTHLAAFRDYTEYLAPGERGVLMILASDRTQAKNILGYINGFFDSVPVLNAMVVNRLKESLELSNRVTIAVHTSSYKATRGYSLIGVIADELAFWADENSSNPAAEVLAAVRPGLATIPNALLLGISSAYSKRGVLFDAHREHFGKDDSPVLIWKAASREMNPLLNPLTLAVAYARDAASARSEYGGEFREDIESLFSLEAIERLVVHDRTELAPLAGVEYQAFVDPSGGVSDSMVLAVSHTDEKRSMAILDCVREIVPPFSPEAATKELCDVLKRYRVHEVEGDRYGAEWVQEAFKKQGVRYVPSERTRSEIYLEFLPMVMSRQAALLDNRKLVNQLVGLDRKTGRGADIIDHSGGAHDDVGNATAGSLVRALAGQRLELTYVNMVVALVEKYGTAWRDFIGKDDDAPVDEPKVELPVLPVNAPSNGREVFSENASVMRAQAAQKLSVSCPQCASPCVVRRGELYHCNVDAFEWRISPSEPPKGQRQDALANTPARQPWPSPGIQRWRQ